jgi:Ku protein, prokaryotic
MASRPVWKGQMRLSLVSIDVELYSATKTTARPRFRQIHEPSGKPIHYQKVAEGVGPVDKDEIMKGFEYEKGDYVLLTEEEIDAVKLETRKTLELTQFVGACEINPLYFEKPYYMVPADDLAEDAFRVIRDALKQTGKVGLGQLALRGQEYLVAVKPSGKGLLLETLRYEEELREADPYFAEIPAEKADPDLLEVATALIDKKTDTFDASAYKDHYVAALRELIDKKLKNKGKRVTADEDDRTPAKPQKSNVIDLMAALKSSLEGGSKGKGAAADKPAAKSRSTKTAAAKSSTSKRSSKSAAAKSTAKPKSAAAPRKKAS